MAENFTPITDADLAKMALPAEFDVERIKNKVLDIQYGTLPEQKLDLYLPEQGNKPFPVIFYVHGGGWYLGTKRLNALDCIIDAVDEGYAVISVDYRLVPTVCFPEFVFDVKTAVRWARANAEQYGLDPNRFGMLGDSAGGHITLMLGLTAGMPEYEGAEYGHAEQSSALQAICDMYGPAVLHADEDAWYAESGVRRMVLDQGNGQSLYETVFGTSNPNLLRLISPVSLVKPDIPPVMIQQGMEDAVVAYQHSLKLAERITEVCGADRVLLKTYPDRNHSDKQFMTTENCKEVLGFFNKYLR